jgi:hypothetical protein
MTSEPVLYRLLENGTPGCIHEWENVFHPICFMCTRCSAKKMRDLVNTCPYVDTEPPPVVKPAEEAKPAVVADMPPPAARGPWGCHHPYRRYDGERLMCDICGKSKLYGVPGSKWEDGKKKKESRAPRACHHPRHRTEGERSVCDLCGKSKLAGVSGAKWSLEEDEDDEEERKKEEEEEKKEKERKKEEEKKEKERKKEEKKKEKERKKEEEKKEKERKKEEEKKKKKEMPPPVTREPRECIHTDNRTEGDRVICNGCGKSRRAGVTGARWSIGLDEKKEKAIEMPMDSRITDRTITLESKIDWKEMDEKFLANARTTPGIDMELLTLLPTWGYYTLKYPNKTNMICRVFYTERKEDGTLETLCIVLQTCGLSKELVSPSRVKRVYQWDEQSSKAISAHLAPWMWIQPMGHYAAFTHGTMYKLKCLYDAVVRRSS